MPAARRSSAPVLPHNLTLTLPDGRTLTQGQEFSVTGEGRFAFAYEYLPDGSVTCFGPVGSNEARWRSFKPERVKTIHKTLKGRNA